MQGHVPSPGYIPSPRFFNNSALLQNNNPVSIKLLTFHGSEQTQKGMQAMMYRHTKSNV